MNEFNLLQNAIANDLITEPFPHVIIYDALPTSTAERLRDEFPRFEWPGQQNTRANYEGHQILSDPDVSSVWKEFVRVNCSHEFIDRFMDIFAPSINEMYGLRLSSDDVGVRGIDDSLTWKATINVAAAVNTPVKEKSVQRGPHLDQPRKLFFGLLYLRSPDDSSGGGDLDIYRLRDTKDFKFDASGRRIDEKYIEKVKTVPYAFNTLVVGVNSLNSVHGVSPRDVTSHPRLFSNFFIEMRKKLFDPKRTSL